MIWCAELSDLKHFISNSRPNDRFKYFTGLNLTTSLLSKELGRIVYSYSVDGKCYLVQMRNKSHFYFDYYMIKASKSPIISLVPFSKEQSEQRSIHYVS